MNANLTHKQTATRGGAAPATGELPTARRWGWLLLLAVIVVSQWSSIQELYYRAFGIEFPESTIAWHHDFESASQDAVSKSKPILAVFGASWCPPCRNMKRHVWPDTEVSRAVEERFVPLYIDVDDQTQQSIASRYQIQSIPAVLVVSADGNVLRKANSMSRAETLQFLNLPSAEASPKR